MMKFLPEEKRDQAVIALPARARRAGADRCSTATSSPSDWIAADRPTTADLSCVGYLYYDHEFGLDLDGYPNIDRWRQAIAALPGWRHPYDLMPGHPLPPPERST